MIKSEDNIDAQASITIDRLVKECAKLDPVEESQLAEDGMAWEIDTWPEYSDPSKKLLDENQSNLKQSQCNTLTKEQHSQFSSK